MIVGLGIDLVEISRIRDLIDRHGEHFLRKTFTEGERAYCSAKANFCESYAARFAAKEATMKALGTGWTSGVGFLSVEVSRLGTEAPRLLLHGEARKLAEKIGADAFHLSLSHGTEHAIAQVVLERRG